MWHSQKRHHRDMKNYNPHTVKSWLIGHNQKLRTTNWLTTDFSFSIDFGRLYQNLAPQTFPVVTENGDATDQATKATGPKNVESSKLVLRVKSAKCRLMAERLPHGDQKNCNCNTKPQLHSKRVSLFENLITEYITCSDHNELTDKTMSAMPREIGLPWITPTILLTNRMRPKYTYPNFKSKSISSMIS